MTREEAIQRFQQMKKILSISNSDAARMIETIDMAIEALKAEPSTEGKYEKAMKTLQEMPRYINNVKAKQIKKISTEAAQGEWIKHEGKWVDFDFYPTKYECNQCHYCVDEGYDSIFCPNCGAKMKGGAE